MIFAISSTIPVRQPSRHNTITHGKGPSRHGNLHSYRSFHVKSHGCNCFFHSWLRIYFDFMAVLSVIVQPPPKSSTKSIHSDKGKRFLGHDCQYKNGIELIFSKNVARRQATPLRSTDVATIFGRSQKPAMAR